MNFVAESYDDVVEKGLEDLREEVGRPKIQHKKLSIYT